LLNDVLGGDNSKVSGFKHVCCVDAAGRRSKVGDMGASPQTPFLPSCLLLKG